MYSFHRTIDLASCLHVEGNANVMCEQTLMKFSSKVNSVKTDVTSLIRFSSNISYIKISFAEQRLNIGITGALADLRGTPRMCVPL